MGSERWRLLRTGPGTGPENMALDEALASLGGGPCLRLYGWTGPCLSLGRFQSLLPAFDLEASRRAAVSLVRRPTGGRAILHQPQEVTYSVAAPSGHWLARRGVLPSYQAINHALVLGLRSLGLEAEALPHPPSSPAGPDPAVACFQRAYRHEVFLDGRKLLASAQSRAGGGLLQQGTLPLASTGPLFASLVAAPPEERAALAQELDRATATPRQALDRPVSPKEVEEALVAGFREAWGIRLQEENPTPDEEALARHLAEEKYGSLAWTHGLAEAENRATG